MGRVRERGMHGEYLTHAGKKYYRTYDGKTTNVTQIQASIVHDYEYIMDEIHPKHPLEGGPLSIIKVSANYSPAYAKKGSYHSAWGGWIEELDHYALITPGVIKAPPDGLEEARSYGPEAYDRFRPKLQTVSLGQFLAELRDFPSLFKFKLGKFRDLGSGYLNYQFGWKPFVSDVRDFLQSLTRLDAQIARLKRQNGKWIKRGGTILDETTRTSADTAGYLPHNDDLYNIRTTVDKVYEEKIWFSSAFRFYIPELESNEWGKLRAAQKLWGLELTPDLMYQLLPFSWLADWCWNLGNCISNLTAATYDNLVARNAYIMRSTKLTYETSIEFDAHYLNTGRLTVTPCVSKSTHQMVTKARAKASPYGFKLDWPDFNQYQLSILSALGLSRQRF